MHTYMRTLYLRDARADHVVLLARQNYRFSTIGYLSNSWASCF